jgi:hypothetical protein
VFSLLALVGCRIRMFVETQNIVLVQFSMFFSIVYAYHLELSTGVSINGGRTMDWIKDLEQTAKPFEVKYV